MIMLLPAVLMGMTLLSACHDKDEPVEIPTTVITLTPPTTLPDSDGTLPVGPSASVSVSVSPSPVDTSEPTDPPMTLPNNGKCTPSHDICE